MRLLALAGLLTALTACPPQNQAVQCKITSDCNQFAGGSCDPNPDTGNLWCSYPDTTCPNGRRWTETDTGDGIGGTCQVSPDVDAGVVDGSVDTTAPTVVSKSPDDGAASVGLSATVSVQFSEAISSSSVTTDSLVVTKMGGPTIAGVIHVQAETATFSPVGMLDPSATYEVKVTTGVTDSAGNHLAAQAAWTFTTGTASWTAPMALANDLDRAADADLSVALKNGFGVAVWPMRVCSGTSCAIASEIWGATYANGTWTTPTAAFATGSQVSASTVGRAVAIDDQGRAMAVWNQRGPQFAQIMASRYVPGTGWSTPIRIDSENLGNATDAAVAIDAAGNAYVAWSQNSGTTPPVVANLWVNRFNGSAWGTATKLNVSGSATFPSVTAGAAGFAAVTWSQGTNVMGSIFKTGSWSAPAVVGAGFDRSNALVLPDSSVVVVWPSTSDVLANRYTGAWGTATPIDAQTTTVQSDMALATSSDSKAIALWVQGQDVWQSRFNPAQGVWGSASKIEAAAGAANDISLEFSTTGRGLAVWSQPGASSMSPWSNIFDPTTAWGIPQLISQDATALVTATHAFYDPTKNGFGAVWVQSTPIGFARVMYAELH